MAAAEFVNFLYQDDRPLSWAGCFLSGFKAFYSESRDYLDLAKVYYSNRSNSVVQLKAFPFPIEFVQTMVSVAVVEGNPGLAILVLLAYVGLSRLGFVWFGFVLLVGLVWVGWCGGCRWCG